MTNHSIFQEARIPAESFSFTHLLMSFSSIVLGKRLFFVEFLFIWLIGWLVCWVWVFFNVSSHCCLPFVV